MPVVQFLIDRPDSVKQNANPRRLAFPFYDADVRVFGISEPIAPSVLLFLEFTLNHPVVGVSVLASAITCERVSATWKFEDRR